VGRYLTSDPIGLNGGGLNTYAYANSEPWGAVDWLGLLVVAHLNTKTGILTVTDEDTKETVTIKAFSGGKAVNGIITEVGVGKNLPMPRGRYIITNNPGKTSPATWYGLLYLDGRINDIIESNDSNINGRAGFRLHPGTLSHGCTTIDTSIPEGQTNWEKVDSLLKATVKTTVIFEEPWYTKNKLMTKYGVLDVTY
ncbi:tlde1 domain-containing protein, partial [Moraxella nonliquefaciens]